MHCAAVTPTLRARGSWLAARTLRLIPAFCIWHLALGIPLSAAGEPPARSFRWKRVPGVAEAIRVFPSCADPNTVLVWTRGGLVVSKDGGKTFAARPAAVAGQLGSVTALLVSPVRPATLYAGTAEKGVFLSRDEGAAWRPLGGTDKGLAHPNIHSLAFSPSDPTFTTLFATHSPERAGLSATFDGGETWRPFAQDFGAGDLILLGTHILFSGTHPAGGTETGFYRSLDAGKNWFRVFNVESPTVLVASKTLPQRAWCGSATAGLYATDNVGVSTRAVGPQTGVNVASIAVGYDTPSNELICLYDPQREGVLASTDAFATWQKLNDGLYVGSWAAQGAMLAASSDGATLFACVNGTLYRGARPEGPVGLSAIRTEPAAVAAGAATTVTCRAAKGAEVRIDLTPISGAAAVPLLDDGKSGDGAADDGLFAARIEVPEQVLTPPKDYKGPAFPGQIALALRATQGQAAESGHALLNVLANPTDRVLWDGEDHNTFSVWSPIKTSGVFSSQEKTPDVLAVTRCQERPLSGGAHVRVQFARAGQAGFSWKHGGGWWDGDDTRAHKLFCFYIRSDKEGPSDLKLALRDDGRKHGHGEGGRSNDLPLAPYLPRLSAQYQYVAIPLADFIWGSAARPEGICELVFVSPSDTPRTYDVDDIGLGVGPGPRLSAGQAVLQPDGKSVALSVRASTAACRGEPRVRPKRGEYEIRPYIRVTAEANGKTFPLGETGDGLYAATVPAGGLGAGVRTVRFVAQDADGTRDAVVRAFLPRRPPGQIAKASGTVKLDADLAEFQDVAPFTLSQGPLSLTARILHGDRNLYFALEVKDPAFAPKKLDAKPEALANGPSVEVLITSPTSATALPHTSPALQDHRIFFALCERHTSAVLQGHRWDAKGTKTDGGYVIEAVVPFDALRVEHQQCDFEAGKSTRIELRLNAADGTKLAWAAKSPEESENPENWGLACFTEEAGPPQLRYERCDGNTLRLISNKRLDQALATNVASCDIAGAQLAKAELRGDGHILLLTAGRPWQVGQHVTLRFPGLRSADGLAPKGSLEFTVLPGRALTAEPLQEFLVGEVRRSINPKTALDEDHIDKNIKPAAGGDWKLARSETGLISLLETVGRFDNSVAHAHAYVFSDSDRTIQLSVGSDDGVKVIVNGATLFVNPAARGGHDANRVKDVPLKKGWNSLLLAISQSGADWNLAVRILDEEGKAPPGVSYTAESPFGATQVVAPKEPPAARVLEATTPDVIVEKIGYLGWKDSWRLRNKACELVVVPQISRVLHFSLRGGENVLYVNRDLAGQTVPKDDVQWHNFGGDKVWPTAQGLWEKYTGRKGWPPPYEFDCAPATAEPVKGGVRLTTPLSPHFGARCIREFVLDPQRPLVRIRQFHEKIEGNPAEMTLWSITQVRKPLFALLPLEDGNRAGGCKLLGKAIEPLFLVHKSVLSLRNHDTEGQKVGVLPDAKHHDGWVAAAYEKLLFVQSHRLEKGASYPDDGCHAELFTAPKALGHYIELELLSPLRELRAGQKLRDDAVWQLVPLPEGTPDDPARLAAIAREAHRTALDVLSRP